MKTLVSRRVVTAGALTLCGALLLGAAARPIIPWEELTEIDWIYGLATRFSLLDSHQVHYKTPTAELASLLEGRSEPEALRHLAQAQMDLGQRDTAIATIERWATAWEGTQTENPGAGFDDAARWAWSYGAFEPAFRFADVAVLRLKGDAQRALANLRVEWAEQQPALRDRRTMQRLALELNATDWASAYTWIDSDIAAGRLDDAETGLANLPKSTPDEPALVLRAKLRIAQNRAAEVLPSLDAALDRAPRVGRLFSTVYVRAIDQSAKSRPDEWRQTLASRFEPAALKRLFIYFKGQQRGDACLALLQQMDRRYQKDLDRAGWSLVSSLYSEIDGVPEAFRARMAAATFGDVKAGESDLGDLIRLALRAGGRPLSWGSYSDADYRWVARMDSTPGFWTGGLSLLLTGQDWKEALDRLEAESVPERTFAAARALLDELKKRNGVFPELPSLKLEVMRRHVDRGEGAPALALLKDIEATASDAVKQKAQAIGLLALRQTKGTIAEETRLYKAQLRYLAPDGTAPAIIAGNSNPSRRFQIGDFPELDETLGDDADTRPLRYKRVLDEAIARLEERDRTHRSSLALALGEMDRLPASESLWLNIAGYLSRWNLDDELGPRFEAAIARFDDPSWWNRLARYLTRQKRQTELKTLAEQIAATFRGASIFARASAIDIRLEVPEQPRVGTRVRLVLWGDWVILKALERFPHSPTVLRAAEGRLISAAAWSGAMADRDAQQRVVVEDSLLAERRWAIFATDAATREAYFADLMKRDGLQAKLASIEAAARGTPVDDLILVEGYARLSLFEKAADPASRLSVAYPGEESVARQALQIHRSLAGLDLSHEAPAKAVVDRTAPALQDPHSLITELGELYEETGRPETALSIWKALMQRDPRQEERISETATLLWDYGHMKEALDVIETGRAMVGRPRMLAFEAGVLREEVKDVEGAIREYLAAVQPEGSRASCYCSDFEQDQRSLRRLAQWMGRDRVAKRVLASIDGLKAGDAADERTLLAYWPLGSISTPTAGVDWDADDWIDLMDQPNDPLGREEREAKRLAARGGEHAGIARVARALVEKAAAMTPRATGTRFLASLESSAASYPETSWATTLERDRFFTNIVARQAEIAPTLEERLALEIDLAQRLASAGHLPEGEALWKTIVPRVEGLPESASKIRTLVARALFLERNGGFNQARPAWDALIAKYPWSLGVIEDRIAFLERNGQPLEARQALEDATANAADGHLNPLLTRLVSQSLLAKDLDRASRGLDRLLKSTTLSDEERLGAISLQARLHFQREPSFAAVPFATNEAAKVKPEIRPQVFAEVARAAGVEKALSTAVTLWIEALNRSTERPWLKEASRAARRAGATETLVSFFEKQQQRSPRDVRWAIAARDLRVATDNLPGGIEMAKIAATVRPERKELWDEAADLMERDQRFIEAADFLDGWNVQRPADPSTAGKRGELYFRGGNAQKAVAVERAALEAFENGEHTDEDLASRKADAVRRIWRQGQPQLAWRFLSADGDLDEIVGSGLSVEEELQLALLNNAFLPLLEYGEDDEDRVSSAAGVLNQQGRIEQREPVVTWLVEKVWPAGRADTASLNSWWTFIENSRSETALRHRLAERMARQIAGPWSADPPADLLDDASESVVTSVSLPDGKSRQEIQTPDFDELWAHHLIRFDRGDELAAFLEPRFETLFARVRGPGAFAASTPRVPWTTRLDSPQAMETFARGLKSQPSLVAGLSSVFEERRLWDRLQILAARGWNPAPLLLQLKAVSRVAWLAQAERPTLVNGADDPVLVARRASLSETVVGLGEYLGGSLGSPAGPKTEPSALAERLLGPSLLRDILDSDPKFMWSMFMPRTNAAGEVLESGDDRIAGQGVDTGARFPGAFWGDRPGLAWFALQTYARYRANDPSSIDVPEEWPESGNETERALLTARLALALKGPAEALARIDRSGLRTSDVELLRFRLQLLIDSSRKNDAVEALRVRITGDQKRLDEPTLRALSQLAEDLDLPAPITMIDPAIPITPALLASIYDREGSDTGRRFETDDPIGFRAALASRWYSKVARLSVSDLRFWITELWANEAASLPVQGLDRLGDFWAQAAPFVQSVPATDRARAIAAIDALPQTALLDALPSSLGDSSARHTLMIRVHLARGEDAQAVSLFKDALEGLSSEEALTFHPVALLESRESDEHIEEGTPQEEEGPEGRIAAIANPRATALQSLREPFLALKKTALIQAEVVGWLDGQIEDQPGDAVWWGMRFDVAADAADRVAVERRLSSAYRRGDIATYRQGELTDLLVKHAKDVAAPWVREAQNFWFTFYSVEKHALRLNAIGARRDAANYLAEARTRFLYTRAEEIRGFDLWRRYADTNANGPEIWKQAARFWRDGADAIVEPLRRRLKEHPLDVLSARAALRRPTPIPPDLAFQTIRALRDVEDLGTIDVSTDSVFLRLRAARSLLSEPRAARAIGGALSPEWIANDLARRRFSARDVDVTLADLARIAATAGDRAGQRAALNLLADRKWSGVKALRAELASLPVDPPMVAQRLVNGRAQLLRPRDLTFALVSQIVQSDLSRRPRATPQEPEAQR